MKPTGQHRFVGQSEAKGQATLLERGYRPVPAQHLRQGDGGPRPFNRGRRRTAVRFQAQSYIGGGQSGGA